MPEILPTHDLTTELGALDAIVADGKDVASDDAIPRIRETVWKPIPEDLADGVSLLQKEVEAAADVVDPEVDRVVEAILKASQPA